MKYLIKLTEGRGEEYCQEDAELYLRNFQTALKIFKNNNNCEGLNVDCTDCPFNTFPSIFCKNESAKLFLQVCIEKLLTSDIVIHTDTKEKFLHVCSIFGIYNTYKENTCLRLDGKNWCDVEYCKKKDSIILSYEDYTNIMGITSSKLLSLSQHGILLTQLNGHYYFHYETDIELSPTDESKWLLNKLSDCGIDIRNKQYGTLEEVLDRFDRLLKWLKESDV